MHCQQSLQHCKLQLQGNWSYLQVLKKGHLRVEKWEVRWDACRSRLQKWFLLLQGHMLWTTQWFRPPSPDTLPCLARLPDENGWLTLHSPTPPPPPTPWTSSISPDIHTACLPCHTFSQIKLLLHILATLQVYFKIWWQTLLPPRLHCSWTRFVSVEENIFNKF
jgi:hypothetical protein